MILVILAICAVMCVISYILMERRRFHASNPGEALLAVSGIFGAIAILVTIGLAVSVSFSGTVDEKINMYTEQNAKIETQIEAAVEKYMSLRRSP